MLCCAVALLGSDGLPEVLLTSDKSSQDKSIYGGYGSTASIPYLCSPV